MVRGVDPAQWNLSITDTLPPCLVRGVDLQLEVKHSQPGTATQHCGATGWVWSHSHAQKNSPNRSTVVLARHIRTTNSTPPKQGDLCQSWTEAEGSSTVQMSCLETWNMDLHKYTASSSCRSPHTHNTPPHSSVALHSPILHACIQGGLQPCHHAFSHGVHTTFNAYSMGLQGHSIHPTGCVTLHLSPPSTSQPGGPISRHHSGP